MRIDVPAGSDTQWSSTVLLPWSGTRRHCACSGRVSWSLAYSPGDDDSLLRSTVLLPGGINKSAEGIERHTDALDATLRRLLAQAATALEGAAAAAPIDPAAPGVVA